MIIISKVVVKDNTHIEQNYMNLELFTRLCFNFNILNLFNRDPRTYGRFSSLVRSWDWRVLRWTWLIRTLVAGNMEDRVYLHNKQTTFFPNTCSARLYFSFLFLFSILSFFLFSPSSDSILGKYNGEKYFMLSYFCLCYMWFNFNIEILYGSKN